MEGHELLRQCLELLPLTPEGGAAAPPTSARARRRMLRGFLLALRAEHVSPFEPAGIGACREAVREYVLAYALQAATGDPSLQPSIGVLLLGTLVQLMPAFGDPCFTSLECCLMAIHLAGSANSQGPLREQLAAFCLPDAGRC